MNAKEAKKLRQLYQRDFAGKVKEITQAAAKEADKLLKEPPKWFPSVLWYWLQKKFLNI